MSDAARVPCKDCGVKLTHRGMTRHMNTAHPPAAPEHPAAAIVKRVRAWGFRCLRGEEPELLSGAAGRVERPLSNGDAREIEIAIGAKLLEITEVAE